MNSLWFYEWRTRALPWLRAGRYLFTAAILGSAAMKLFGGLEEWVDRHLLGGIGMIFAFFLAFGFAISVPRKHSAPVKCPCCEKQLWWYCVSRGYGHVAGLTDWHDPKPIWFLDDDERTERRKANPKP